MRKKNLPVCAPKIFEHEQFGQIRFVTIDWEPWFVAVDVCKVLDIQNVRQNLANFPDDEKADVCITYTSSNGVTQKRNVTVVSEPGLYRLIFMSRKPEAEKIKRWVCHEVLPSIRKHGYYVAPHQKIIRIEGRDNLERFKAQYPEGTVEIKRTLIDFDEKDNGEWEDITIFEVVVHSTKKLLKPARSSNMR